MWEEQRQFRGRQFEAAESVAEVLQRVARELLLSNVVFCESCAQELEDLETVAESLFILVDVVDPPVSFESRVMERIRSSNLAHGGDGSIRNLLGRTGGQFCRSHRR